MTLPLVYITGPFRSATLLEVQHNVERARDVGLAVAQRTGGYPVIPHMMTSEFDKSMTDDFWLAGTMELLRRCDAVMLMSTWELSSGARAEQAEAERRGIPVFDQLAELALFVKGWKMATGIENAADITVELS